jgi:hypothetical protein
MDRDFKVGDNFIGRKDDILNLPGVIGGVKGDGRHVEVLCRFAEGYEEWRLPKDLWKVDVDDEDGSGEESSSDDSSDSLSEDDSQDSDTSSGSESSDESEEVDEQEGGNSTY